MNQGINSNAFVRDPRGLYRTVRAVTEGELIAHAASLLESRLRGDTLSSPQSSGEFLRLKLAQEEREVFACLFLDARHRVIDLRVLFKGTIDSATVHPREVVKAALQLNAAAAILTHNHPSGHPEPSEADKHLTIRIKEALSLIDVRVLDHIVVGTEGWCSFADRGLL